LEIRTVAFDGRAVQNGIVGPLAEYAGVRTAAYTLLEGKQIRLVYLWLVAFTQRCGASPVRTVADPERKPATHRALSCYKIWRSIMKNIK
jgi:hypothetical protein